MVENTQRIPDEIWVTLSGPIDQNLVSRVFAGFANVVQGGAKKVHLLIQSGGGIVGDGLALYHYFRGLPIELITYNTGSIASIAVFVYLGAKTRKASTASAFMVHRTYSTGAIAIRSENANAMADILRNDDVRTRLILDQNVTLTKRQAQILRIHELWLTSEEAIKTGLATEIGEFVIPDRSLLFNI